MVRRLEPYFIKDGQFLRSLFHIAVGVAFQGIINYSVNIVDNLMLGAYGQVELSAAACVNQIFFIVNAFMWNIGVSFSVLASQYWGQRRTDDVNRLGGIELKVNLAVAAVFFAATLFPRQLLQIFTSDEAIIAQGVAYLRIIKYTFIPYAVSCTLTDLLRTVETVNIAFYLSIAALVINAIGNNLLIFGKAGFPCLGVEGAAIATLAGRIVEMLVLIIYVARVDRKLRFFRAKFWERDKKLAGDYAKVAVPVVAAGVCWALGTPVQGALLGKLSADAIAANSVTSTYFQLMKVIAQALGSAAGIVIGISIGSGNLSKTRSGARTIEAIAVGIGLAFGGILLLLREPVMHMYELTAEAERLVSSFMYVMSAAIVPMTYAVTVLFGIIRGGGDTKFPSSINAVALWCISMPLAFLAVYRWNLDPVWVVIFIQSELLIKCIPAAFRLRRYDKWIHVMTRNASTNESLTER